MNNWLHVNYTLRKSLSERAGNPRNFVTYREFDENSSTMRKS